MAIAALVCGILGIIGMFLPIIKYFSFILAILAIRFGVIARKEARKAEQETGMATAGLVLGIIGVCIGGIAVLCVICAFGTLGSMLTM